MYYCISKRVLSGVDDSIPLFSLNGYEGYARITSVYDGDTFKACILLHNRVLKFNFRTLGYDSPELKPLLNIPHRDTHISQAVLARDVFKELVGFDDRAPHQWWNPFICKNTVNGWIWIKCHKNDKYGRTLVTVYKNKNDPKSINDIMIESQLVNVYDGGKKKVFS
jgi:endonuclease YncB( thermonuclease family)